MGTAVCWQAFENATYQAFRFRRCLFKVLIRPKMEISWSIRYSYRPD